MKWMVLVVVLFVFSETVSDGNNDEQLDLTTVDVANLATHAYGTELLLLENKYKDEKTYSFEDFFWTGSGDGPSSDENHWTSEPDIIYETKTVVSTVFVTSKPANNETLTESPPKCTLNCEAHTTPKGSIAPTPVLTTLEPHTFPEEEDFFDADKQFWLLTVLKSDGKDPVIIDLKNSLAKLYKTAFQRQQERHLGINDKELASRIKRAPIEKPVHVYIHKIRNSTVDKGDGKIEVLYHVAVAGKPVDPVTAAEDMTLVSDEEVRKELGYPFTVKAEPYLKASEPQASQSEGKNTWFFIGFSITGFIVFLLIVAFLILAFAKRKRAQALEGTTGIDNRKHVFERGVGIENKGFTEESSQGTVNVRESPTYIKFVDQPRRGSVAVRPLSSRSTTSSSSGSLDISPLMSLGKKLRTPPKKPPRPRAALNKTVPLNIREMPSEVFDSDSSSSAKDTPDTIFTRNCDPGVVSPKSYLSMPSVKAFPKGNIPEPLNKVLEPVSVLHLDMPDDEGFDLVPKKSRSETFIRHGSVGSREDPGVIGPVVWNMHCKRLQHGVSVDEGINDMNMVSNVSKMRKRFHDLLDDTFSLFGSRKESPVDSMERISRPTTVEVKSHSAINNRPTEDKVPTPKPRPKTTDLRRAPEDSGGTVRGAWASTVPSPLVRPLSAGIVSAPRVNVDLVLAEGKFRSNDPAIPLIAAIKTEIERVSLPGSTTDLRQ